MAFIAVTSSTRLHTTAVCRQDAELVCNGARHRRPIKNLEKIQAGERNAKVQATEDVAIDRKRQSATKTEFDA
jgi:hypothetical protein